MKGWHLLLLAFPITLALGVGWWLDGAAFEAFVSDRPGADQDQQLAGLGAIAEWFAIGAALGFGAIGWLARDRARDERLDVEKEELALFCGGFGGVAGLGVGASTGDARHLLVGAVMLALTIAGAVKVVRARRELSG